MFTSGIGNQLDFARAISAWVVSRYPQLRRRIPANPPATASWPLPFFFVTLQRIEAGRPNSGLFKNARDASFFF